jgi:hypothetical protein
MASRQIAPFPENLTDGKGRETVQVGSFSAISLAIEQLHSRFAPLTRIRPDECVHRKHGATAHRDTSEQHEDSRL